MVSQEAMAGFVPCGSGSGSVSNSMVQRSGVSVPSGWFWNNALRNQGMAGVPLSSTIRLAPQGQDSINNLVRLGSILGGRLLGSTGLVALVDVVLVGKVGGKHGSPPGCDSARRRPPGPSGVESPGVSGSWSCWDR